ncbi:MAG: heavy-metal-associated domain-containing protein [Flavobacteriaceae bacterium]
MKKIILMLLLAAPLSLLAQKKDIQKTSFEVEGVCGMCKARIEKTALKIKGIKTANWDIPTHQFTILFDANKVRLEEFHQAIENVGHDTPLATASDEVYENLPMCCLYDRKKKVE